MNKRLKLYFTKALGIIGVIFTFVPEDVFKTYKLLSQMSDEMNIIFNRSLIYIVVFFLIICCSSIYRKYRKHIDINGKNYNIRIQEKDLFKMKNCKKVIPFDECFTTKVGDAPEEINPNSICGQYIAKYSIKDQEIQDLINIAQLRPTNSRSKYQNKIKYESGKLIQKNDYLLMAFAKLDENGLGVMTRKEYIACLEQLWIEIDKYYGQRDVCVPILGSGVTRMEDTSLTQQELLDIMIESYKLSIHKIKAPHRLYIAYRKCDDFSLDKIGESI